MNYWQECISEAFDSVGIEASQEQINYVASWVEGSHENYGMAHGYDAIPNQLSIENAKIESELKEEKSKVGCKECNGMGVVSMGGPYHSSLSTCSRCRGYGKHLPD